MIEKFLNPFRDMKESAKAQHEVDKAAFAAVKAESKANFAQAKLNSSPQAHKAAMQKEREKQLDQAHARIAAAEKRMNELS